MPPSKPGRPNFFLRFLRSLAVQAITIATVAALSKLFLALTSVLVPLLLLLVFQIVFTAILLIAIGESLGLILANTLFFPLFIGSVLNVIPNAVFVLVGVALMLVFYPTFRTGVPLFTSSRAAVEAFLNLVPHGKKIIIAELGAGEGTLTTALVSQRPNVTVHAFELGVVSFIALWLRSLRRPSILPHFQDFMKSSWGDFDILYCFLAPPVMPQVWEKFSAEARPGAMLVSNAFPVSGMEANQTIALGNKLESAMYIYKKKSD